MPDKPMRTAVSTARYATCLKIENHAQPVRLGNILEDS